MQHKPEIERIRVTV